MTLASVKLNADGKALAVRLPIRFRRCGGRKLVVTPAGHEPRTSSQPRLLHDDLRAAIPSEWSRQRALLSDKRRATRPAAKRHRPSH